jgi:hypothetical protein
VAAPADRAGPRTERAGLIYNDAIICIFSDGQHINDAITSAAYRDLFADRTGRLTEVFPTDPADGGEEYAHRCRDLVAGP